MFLIRLERRTKDGERVEMWLTRISPPLWGEREAAVKFPSKGDARRAAAMAKVSGAWFVERVRDD